MQARYYKEKESYLKALRFHKYRWFLLWDKSNSWQLDFISTLPGWLPMMCTKSFSGILHDSLEIA